MGSFLFRDYETFLNLAPVPRKCILMHTHTHTHMACTHACTATHMCTVTHTCMHTHHTYVHIHTHAHTSTQYIFTHTHVHILSHTHVHITHTFLAQNLVHLIQEQECSRKQGLSYTLLVFAAKPSWTHREL